METSGNEDTKNNQTTATAAKEIESNELFQKDLDVCTQELAHWQGKYARLSADFENYKRRMVKEQSSWMLIARAQLLTDLLSTLDNFDRAMEHTDEKKDVDMQRWADGIKMIHQSFHDYLDNVGVKQVPYDLFDPSYHEALLHVDSKEHKPGDIVQVMEKGYVLGDRVLRPAKVSVAK